MKKKLKLNDLQVQSFVTIETNEQDNIKGGMRPLQSYDIPCSDFARCTPPVTLAGVCDTLIPGDC